MAAIAVCVGAIGYFVLGLALGPSIAAGLVVLLALGAVQFAISAWRERSTLDERIEDLSEAVAHVMRRISALEERFDDIGTSVAEQVAIETQTLQSEMTLIERAVRELADTVEAQGGQGPGAPVAPEVEPEEPEAEAPAPEPAFEMEPEPVFAPRPVEQLAPAARDATDLLRRFVEDAVRQNRADLYLQPIVTLPQRKVRHYEAVTKLRSGDGQTLEPEMFRAAARAAGVAHEIDRVALLRSLHILRKLKARGRDVGVFWNVAAASLARADFFQDVLSFLDTNRDLAGSLVVEVSQSALASLGPVEEESVAAIGDLGFRFSMDQVQKLRFDTTRFAALGVRFVKIDAELLLASRRDVASDIHPANVASLLRRAGIELIASRIETESMAVDLLDFEVRLAQGGLFSAPRPVRSDLLDDGPVQRVAAL